MSNDSKKKETTTEEGSIFEKVMPDSVKGRLKHIVGDLKMPKEIVTHIMSQVDDTKQAAVGVISREVRLFLERTNLADEMAKLLTQVSFQIKTEVSFVPNEKAKKDTKEPEAAEEKSDDKKAVANKKTKQA